MSNAADLGTVHRFVPPRNEQRGRLLLHGTGGDEIDLVSAGQVTPYGARNSASRSRSAMASWYPNSIRRLVKLGSKRR